MELVSGYNDVTIPMSYHGRVYDVLWDLHESIHYHPFIYTTASQGHRPIRCFKPRCLLPIIHSSLIHISNFTAVPVALNKQISP